MSNPIRVLQIFAQMNRGGAETMIMNLYRNIDRSKVQFDFIVHTEEKCAFDDEIASLGGMIHRVPRYTGRNHFQYTNCWNNFFEKHDHYKIIHGHVRSTAIIYLKIAKKNGLTTIAHSHSTSSGSGLPALVKNILQYPIRYFSDYFFACSRNAGEWLFGKKVCSNEKFFILNNAIDGKKFIFNEEIRNEKRKEFKIEDKFVIGHVGRFNTPKNHEFLIDIFKAVYEKNNSAVLLLVGDGELRQLIEKKLSNLGFTDNVIFTGVSSDIPKLIQAMDIFVFPSLYEGLPVTVIEAQAASLTCIISNSITEEVDMGLGLVEFVSLEKSSKQWANIIIKNKYSNKENTVEELIKRGYDITTTTNWITSFYTNLV